MPSGRCLYPHHHSGPAGSSGLPLGLLAVIALAALVIVYAHIVILVLIGLGALALVAVVAVVVLHSSRSEPYDLAYALPAEEPASPVRATAERVAPAPPQVIEQHLHLHGVTAAEVAEAIASRQEPLYQFPAEPYIVSREKQ